MVFEKYIPHFPLSNYIENIIYHEGYDPNHTITRFLPDGNTEIIIDLTDTPKYLYDSETFKEIQSCHQAWVSGIRTESIFIPSGRQSRMFVISFRKGCAYPFYPMPIDEITNYVIDADLIFGSKIFELRNRLLEADTLQAMFTLLEDFFYLLAGDKIQSSISTKCIDFAVDKMLEDPSPLQLKALAQKIGYSQKHFIQLFTKQVGISPKAYTSILRFQKAITEVELEFKKKINWNSIAFNSGYYDQAHFNRDFKQFAGITPGNYLAQKGDFLNYVPLPSSVILPA